MENFLGKLSVRPVPSCPVCPSPGRERAPAGGGHVLIPHTPHPKTSMFPLHSQRCGGKACFPLRHQARQAHAVDAQGRVQVRSVRLRVRGEGEGRPQGFSGGVEHQSQTRHCSREDRGVGVQPLRPFYSPSSHARGARRLCCVSPRFRGFGGNKFGF